MKQNREQGTEARGQKLGIRNGGIKVACIFLLLLPAPCSLLPAIDFGLIINQSLTLTDGDYTGYTASAIPWFAAPLGARADVYLSGSIGGEIENGQGNMLFEVFRSELTFNYSDNVSFTLGRHYFRDSFGLIMNGLFDGLSATWDIGGGRLNMGFFYTGLLYKHTASINMSARDNDSMDDDTYFASRRIAGGINWGKTSIFNTPASLWLSGIVQIDVNDVDDDQTTVHSQYLAARFTLPFSNVLNLELGGSLGLLQETGFDVRTGFAASAALQQLFFGRVPGMLSLGGRLATTDFVPITGEAQGMVLRPVFSGIALVQASYAARLHDSLFADVNAAYLFRTDTQTFTSAGLNDQSQSPLLGLEFFLNLSWAPLSDVMFTLGGGLFFPQMGKAFTDESATQYRVEVTAVISL